MSYTMEDYRRDSTRRLLQEITPQEVLENLSEKHQRELLKGLAEKHWREIIESLPMEKRLEGLSDKQIQEYFTHRPKGSTSRKRKGN